MRTIPLGVVPARAWADSAAFAQRKYEQQAGNVPASHPIQQGSLRRAFFIRAMACHTCDYINNEILRKAKEAADALLALVKPKSDALNQNGTQQG